MRLSNTELPAARSWFLVGIGRSEDVEHGDVLYNGGGGQAAGHDGDLHGDGLHEGGLHAGGLHGGRLHGGGSEVDAMAGLQTGWDMVHRHNSNNNNRGCG